MLILNKNEKKDVTLCIQTLVIDPTAPELSEAEVIQLLQSILDDGEPDVNVFDRLIEGGGASEIELCTEAVATLNDNGCVEITYRENEDDPQIATTSRIIFHPESPNLVSMTKEGAISTYLSFEEGRTHVCTYDTPFMPFKVYVNSSTVRNTLLEDGRLKLNYLLNINDTPEQQFVIEITLRESENDTMKELFN